MSDPKNWEEELKDGDRDAYQEVCWRLDTVRWSMVESEDLNDDGLMAFDLAYAAFKEKYKDLDSGL